MYPELSCTGYFSMDYPQRSKDYNSQSSFVWSDPNSCQSWRDESWLRKHTSYRNRADINETKLCRKSLVQRFHPTTPASWDGWAIQNPSAFQICLANWNFDECKISIIWLACVDKISVWVGWWFAKVNMFVEVNLTNFISWCFLSA